MGACEGGDGDDGSHAGRASLSLGTPQGSDQVRTTPRPAPRAPLLPAPLGAAVWPWKQKAGPAASCVASQGMGWQDLVKVIIVPSWPVK